MDFSGGQSRTVCGALARHFSRIPTAAFRVHFVGLTLGRGMYGANRYLLFGAQRAIFKCECT